MFALVLGAVRARSAQAVTALILTVLATGAAAASPWYMLAATHRATVADVAAAPTGQRMLSVRRVVATGGDPRSALTSFSSSVREFLPVQDANPMLGMMKSLMLQRATTALSVTLAYRNGFCARVRLTGACPAAADEVAISTYAAESLGLEVGDPVTMSESPDSAPVRLRVVARYELVDPADGYWADPLFSPSRGDAASLDPMFTALDTFAHAPLSPATIAYDVPLPDRLLRGDGGYDLAGTLHQTDYRLDNAEYRMVTQAQDLLGAIANDTSAIRLAVLVGAVEVVVLCWFALGLAGRYTARERRNDVALLRLRGTTRTGVLRLAVGQHLAPMLVGTLIGIPAGYLAARALAGAVTGPQVRQAALLSAAAAAAVLLGGLTILTLVEAAVLRAPVAVLLRRVPPRRRGWRADAVDLVLVAGAVAGTYQARASASSSAPTDRGLELLAPALVALAMALLLARLLGQVADRGGGSALRGGRLRLGLTALQISRQPGIDRVFALVVVAVAVLGTAAEGWVTDSAARADRANVELGAPRVLTVQAANRIALLYAVQNADPAGRQAMAAVVNPNASPPVLAVDTARLAAVARWRPEFGRETALADAAHAAQPVPELPPVTGAELVLRVRSDAAEPVDVLVQLENQATGLDQPVFFGPLTPGEHDLSARVDGCGTGPGCRLVRLALVAPPDPNGQPGIPPRHSAVTVIGLSQRSPSRSILDAPSLSDPRRWRTDTIGSGMILTARAGTLGMELPSTLGGFTPGSQAFVVDAPLPLPVVIAGPRPHSWLFADPALDVLGAGTVPVRVAASATVLPVLGRAGILVDLRAAQRVSADAGSAGTFQVWLADTAPPSLVDRLQAGGLTVLRDDSLAARQRRLAGQGPAVAAWFQLLAGAAGLLLAAATLAVAVAVDRAEHVGALRALRAQGLSHRAALAVGYAGHAALVVLGLVGGLLAAVVAHYGVNVPAQAFADGWNALPVPDGLRPAVLAVAGLVALVILGLTWWASAAPLARELRDGHR
jgi:putative ABC transport system permease protein